MTQTSLNQVLKTKLRERRAMLVPGAANALSARVIEDLRFEAVYITGAGVTNTFFGLPDLGFMGVTDIVQHTMAIRQAVSLPIIVDADTGFGNALNVHHTVRALEQAGANGIQLEDQIMPKKCGHFSGKDVVALPEAVERIHAAVEARKDGDFQVIARTDARATLGLDAALERATRFIEAGADVVFVEAPETEEEVRQVLAAFDVPQVLNLVLGGRTPIIGVEEAKALGCGMVLYANIALHAAVAGMQASLTSLKERGRMDESAPGVASFADRQRLVRKSYFDELERRYAVESAT